MPLVISGLCVALPSQGAVFDPQQLLASPDSPRSLAAADLNGDGLADLLIAYGGGVCWLVNLGGGQFTQSIVAAGGTDNRHAIALDVDVDGDLDGDDEDNGSMD